jgi:polyferredoxin
MPKNARKKPPVLPVLQAGSSPSAGQEKKSGRGALRACVLIFVHVILLLHIAHYLKTGRSVSPVEPSEAIATIELGHVNAGAIMFGLAIASTAIFGRFFCGWACHLVALQDLCSYLLRRLGLRPKPFRSRLLVFVPFALAFYMFLWPTVKRLWRGDTHPGFSNHLLTENFWQTFPGPVVTVLTFLVCGGLIVWLLGNKGFCTYACPYGAFFSVADRVAPARIRVTDDCHQCGRCTANCTSNVMVHAEVRDFGMVVDPGCMKCMDCVSVCPNGALYYGIARSTASDSGNSRNADPSRPPRTAKSYDFSLPEELFGLVVTGLTVFAFRGLYDIVPLLLAVATGVITAWLAILFKRLFHKRDIRLQALQLKRNGRLTPTGSFFTALLVAWFGFTLHSAAVQFYRVQGRQNLANVSPAVSWSDLLDGRVQSQFTADNHARIDSALAAFEKSDSIGWKDVLEVKYGLATACLMKGDSVTAEKFLRQAYDVDPVYMRDIIMEFLVSQGRQEEAAAFQ